MIVVDTNVASELMKRSPSPAVKNWVLARGGNELFTTSITLAEILYGVGRLPHGRRKELLRSTAEEVFAAFADRVLPFDSSAASHYAELVSNRDRLGRPIDGFDAQIAAICRGHRAALATRNVDDFDHTGVDLIDPWQPS
jgi:toxin FitB